MLELELHNWLTGEGKAGPLEGVAGPENKSGSYWWLRKKAVLLSYPVSGLRG